MQFTTLRYFAFDGTDHNSYREQTSMIRRYIAWRNRHVTDPQLLRPLLAANSAPAPTELREALRTIDRHVKNCTESA